MKKTTYVVLEGSEGTGKGTQTAALVRSLEERGFSVLQTKEPGSELAPLTMKLREIMLDGKYENQITKEAREMISQAIRSIHLNKVIYPAMGKYDFIIQDRGIFSGITYGVACDNPADYIIYLANKAIGEKGEEMGLSIHNLYDHVILFKGNVGEGLNRALKAKQEFADGDAMENRGLSFLEKVSHNFYEYQKLFKNVTEVYIEDKSIETITQELLNILQVE